MKKYEGKDDIYTCTKDLPFGILALVFLLQLSVAVISCFLWAANIQEFIAKSNLPNLLGWLESWDGVRKNTAQTVFLRPESLNWIKRRACLQLTELLVWCSINHLSCLVLCFTFQAFVVVVSRKKRLSATSFSCLLWVVLLVNSRKRAPFSRMLNVLLSGFTCCLSLYLVLMCSVGNRIFGQIKNRKKTPKLEMGRNDEENDALEITKEIADCNAVLPEELLAEEISYNLDENVGSLSLGPPDNALNILRKQNETTGSWFRSNLCEPEGDIYTSRNMESTSIANTLIWPARFHLNGLSLHSRKNENKQLELRKNAIRERTEFSDDEFANFSEDNSANRKRADRLQNEVRKAKDDSRQRETTSLKNYNVLQVILVCSLTLNISLVWLFKDSIRKALITT